MRLLVTLPFLVLLAGCSWIAPYVGDFSSTRERMTPGDAMQQGESEDAARALSNQGRLTVR